MSSVGFSTIAVFWDVTRRSSANIYEYFGGNFCLQFQGRRVVCEWSYVTKPLIDTLDNDWTCMFNKCGNMTWYNVTYCNIIHKEVNMHTNSKEQDPLSDAGEEMIRLLWNSYVHSCVHRADHWSLPWAEWIQSIPLTPNRFKIYFNIIIPSMTTFPKWFSC